MKKKKMLFCGRKKDRIKVKYVHPAQNPEMKDLIDSIINQLGSAILIAKKMQVDNCELETFRMYKKMFHEMWLGVAEYYNTVNHIDLEQCSDGRIVL